MSTRTKILQLLADGDFHSGTEMGESLGLSRAAINKTVKSLQMLGIEIHCVTGKGYRVANPQPPLSKDKILHYLSELGSDIKSIYILDEIDSTNSYLQKLSREEPVSGHVCISESQLDGKGRRGNQWLAPAYRNIIMSMAWEFQTGPAQLGGLSLAAGVAVANSLSESGIAHVRLKWPNDIILENKKLGGLLIEIQGEASGPCLAILGIGINIDMGMDNHVGIDQPWIDVLKATSKVIDRNRLSALLVHNLGKVFRKFESSGFACFREQWLSMNAYPDQNVKIIQGEVEHIGRISNIDKNGALYLRGENGIEQVFYSGEVSLRSGN